MKLNIWKLNIFWNLYFLIPWCWERLKAEGKEDGKGGDGWMASPIQWTWVWASSGSWWWTGKPSLLQSMGLQRVGYDWAELTEYSYWEVWTNTITQIVLSLKSRHFSTINSAPKILSYRKHGSGTTCASTLRKQSRCRALNFCRRRCVRRPP